MSTGDIITAISIITKRPKSLTRGPRNRFLERELHAAYRPASGLKWAILAIVFGIVIAGMWNYKVVDGFGQGIVATHLVGDTKVLAGSFVDRGPGFGIAFAAVAGLAATFTACNCVVYAMLPGLACSLDNTVSRKKALNALVVFAGGVVIVNAVYGLYVGTLGVDGAKVLNDSRLPQAEITFTFLGAALIVWGAIAFGFLDGITSSLPVGVRVFFSRPQIQIGVMGIIVGLFAVGRPYPVFRDELVSILVEIGKKEVYPPSAWPIAQTGKEGTRCQKNTGWAPRKQARGSRRCGPWSPTSSTGWFVKAHGR